MARKSATVVLAESSCSCCETSYSSTSAWRDKNASTNRKAYAVPADSTEKPNSVSRRGLDTLVTLVGGYRTSAFALLATRDLEFALNPKPYSFPDRLALLFPTVSHSGEEAGQIRV